MILVFSCFTQITGTACCPPRPESEKKTPTFCIAVEKTGRNLAAQKGGDRRRQESFACSLLPFPAVLLLKSQLLFP